MNNIIDNTPPPIRNVQVERLPLTAMSLVKLSNYCHNNLDSLTVGPQIWINVLEEKNSAIEERHQNGDFHVSNDKESCVRTCGSTHNVRCIHASCKSSNYCLRNGQYIE